MQMESSKNLIIHSETLRVVVLLTSAKKESIKAVLSFGMAMEVKTNSLQLSKKDLITISSAEKPKTI